MLKHRMGNHEGTMQSHTHIEQKTQNKAKQNKTKNTIQKFIYYLKQVYFRLLLDNDKENKKHSSEIC